ncbi:unnamed protein product [Schistosoma curassoni]|uniref:HMG box domain-containing protein n=1 Tax=Schistosoma curassoni TaxID=6186 RepID=A0A183K8D4_9TREM|nr:unnamed protein product [Schistosoma curassoni]
MLTLFAQHIRRNVLRVFSDASNSVISQQLGDLWRTVPRSCRNQYDDEANRLVKIHQIEFPNYKYQPKKRQITSSSSSSSSSSTTTTTATTTTANTSRSNNDQMRMLNPNQFHNTTQTLTQSSISMNNIREDQLITSSKLLPTNLLKTSTDYNVVYSSCSSSSASSSSSSSSTVTNKLPTLSNRNYSIPCISSMNSSVVKGQTTNGNNELMNNFMTSPSKLVCNTIYAKLEPKPLSVNIINTTNNSSIPMNNNNNTTNSSQTLSFKPTIHSLSSVLPPLITLSSNHHHHAHHPHHHHQTNGLMNEQFSLGICDSAYASGINSSSSSSAASSPAVGELISPAKSYSSTFSSLSSSSTSSSLSNMNIKQTKQSPIRHEQLTDELMNDTLILQENNNDNNNNRMVTTDILTPVYIQLDHEGQNPLTEGLMLTLPPGTTFIQANHDSVNRGIPLNNNNTISKRFYITNGNRMIPAISKSVQILQPLKVMNVIHHHHHVHSNHSSSSSATTTTTTATTTPLSSSLLSYPEPILYSPLMSSSELLSSSSSYSCNSSPNSIVSPLSGDVFLPMQQVEMMSNSTHFNTYDQQSTCMDIYQFNGQNQLDMCIEEEEEEEEQRVHEEVEEGEQILIDERRITQLHSKNLDTITNIISIDECMDAVNNDTFISNTNSSGILHNWSSNLPFSESMLMSSSTSTSTSSSGSLLSSTGSSSSSSSSLPLTTTKTMITMNNNDYDHNEHDEGIGASNRHLPLTIDIMKSTNENFITLSSTSSSTITTLNPPPNHHHHPHHLHHNSSISIDNDLNDTDFSITNDNDNFDSSFDAMMNSIDITTFLPGTFQTNEEQDQSIHNDYDHVQLNSYRHNQHEFMKMDEFDESCHIINDVIATTTTITSATTVATIASSSAAATAVATAASSSSSSSSFMNKPTNSQLYNVIRSDIDLIHYNHLENENRTVRIISPLQKIGKQSSLTYSHPISSSSSSSLQGTQCSISLSSSSSSTSSSSSSSTSSVLRMNSLHELLNNSPQVCSSTLADLDSLDKSSLFIIKPEWSVFA